MKITRALCRQKKNINLVGGLTIFFYFCCCSNINEAHVNVQFSISYLQFQCTVFTYLKSANHAQCA